ncbi:MULTISPECIES: hypothetical protein [unclassified Streptomyces]|uniref:hypothetical protein n=1 Tax=unclassified Streptomyces TaxID=2593676 RepID=UPI00159F2953|nr:MULTISPECIES: hypothetical protein [unclassified Streptomyces]
MQDLAGDEAGVVRDQEAEGAAEISRDRPAFDGLHGRHAGDHLVGGRAVRPDAAQEALRRHQARGDRVDRDAAVAEFVGERPGQRVHGALAGHVRQVAVLRRGDARTRVDDAPPPDGPHPRRERLGEEQDRLDVDRLHPSPQFDRHVVEVGEGKDPGVVDEDVAVPVPVEDRADHGVDL